MTEVILVAHGKLAIELKNSLNMIFGETPQFHAVSFLPNEGFDTVKGKIEALLPELGEQILIMTDIFGGTPFNAACAVAMGAEGKAIEVISGMSMPLALEAVVLLEGGEAASIANTLIESSKQMVKRFEAPVHAEEELEDDEL